MADAYRRTEAARWDRDRERRTALLDALLDGAGPSDGPAASEAAAQLGLPERGRFAVVVLGAGDSGGSGVSGVSGVSRGLSGPGGSGGSAGLGSSGDPGGPGRPGAGPAASGLRVLWRIRADGETGLVDLGHHPLESVRELLGPLRARAGVSPVVETPGDLARARWLAALALRTVPASGGPCTCLL